MFFSGGNRELKNMPFKHHLVLGETYLAINGCVMATWSKEEEGLISCCVKAPGLDESETSSE